MLQYIGAMRLAAEHAAIKLDDEDLQGAKERLREVERLAASAYSDINEEIATLLFSDGQQNGVLSCIREYLTRFQQQWNLPIVFTVVDPSGIINP